MCVFFILYTGFSSAKVEMDQSSYQQGVATAMAAMMGMDSWQQASGSMGQGRAIEAMLVSSNRVMR